MISLHNIFSIAKYEITTLLRSWFFRIFALLAIFLNIYLVVKLGDYMLRQTACESARISTLQEDGIPILRESLHLQKIAGRLNLLSVI